MANSTPIFEMPLVVSTSKGDERRVGFEVEFSGLSVEKASRVVADCLGATANRTTEYEFEALDSHGRTWGIERDQEILKRMGKMQEEGDVGVIDTVAEAALRAGSELLVPVEVVSPPLGLSELDEFATICSALRTAGAKGTTDSFAYAFGLHINPEIPDLHSNTIRNYLRAFCALQDWLFHRASIDTARQVTRHTEAFSKAYVMAMLAADEEQSIDALIDSYLTHNPTRNRALDMLPLLSEIDAEKIQRVVDDPRVKSRPTFHYRLPNSEIDNTHWSPALAWNDWIVVELLATDQAKLSDLCKLALAHYSDTLTSITHNWHDDTDEWLRANLL